MTQYSIKETRSHLEVVTTYVMQICVMPVMPPQVSLYKKWLTKSISVSFFTYQVKEATHSLQIFLEDNLLQPSKANRAVEWNHAGTSESINQYTVSSIGHCCKRSFCAVASKKDGPTECLTLQKQEPHKCQ